jgi:hypothetical protein
MGLGGTAQPLQEDSAYDFMPTVQLLEITQGQRIEREFGILPHHGRPDCG